MDASLKRVLCAAATLLIFFFLTPQVPLARQDDLPAGLTQSPQIQELLRSGKISPLLAVKLLDAVKSGRLSPEEVQALKQKVEAGELTAEDIAAGEVLLQGRQSGRAEEEAHPESHPGQEEQQISAGETPPAQQSARSQAGQEPEEGQKLEIFGHNLFRRSPGTFEPITSAPVSDSYMSALVMKSRCSCGEE